MGRANALEMAAGCTILLMAWSRSSSARCEFETRRGISLHNVALWQHFTDVKTVFGDVRLR